MCNHEDFPNEEVHVANRWEKSDAEGPEVEFFVSNNNNDNEERKNNELEEGK